MQGYVREWYGTTKRAPQKVRGKMIMRMRTTSNATFPVPQQHFYFPFGISKGVMETFFDYWRFLYYLASVVCYYSINVKGLLSHEYVCLS